MPRRTLVSRKLAEGVKAAIEQLPRGVARRSPYVDLMQGRFKAVRKDVLADKVWTDIIAAHLKIRGEELPHKRTARRLYVSLCEAYGLNPDLASPLEAHFTAVRKLVRERASWDKIVDALFRDHPKKPSRAEYERLCEAYAVKP
jgi:hypothetical protein